MSREFKPVVNPYRPGSKSAELFDRHAEIIRGVIRKCDEYRVWSWSSRRAMLSDARPDEVRTREVSFVTRRGASYAARVWSRAVREVWRPVFGPLKKRPEPTEDPSTALLFNERSP